MDDFNLVVKISGSMDQGLGGGQACLEVRAGEDDATLAAACQGLEETPGWWHEGSDYNCTDGLVAGMAGSVGRLIVDCLLDCMHCCAARSRTLT